MNARRGHLLQDNRDITTTVLDSYDKTAKTENFRQKARTCQSGQDREDRTARTGQQGKDSRDGRAVDKSAGALQFLTAGTKQPRQDRRESRNRRAGTGLPGQDIQDRTVGKGQPEKAVRIVQLG
jgi:hypothetical protein